MGPAACPGSTVEPVDRGPADPAPPFICRTIERVRERRLPHSPTPPHLGQVELLALSLTGYSTRESRSQTLPGGTLELSLLVGSQARQPCGRESKKAAHSPPSHAMWWPGGGKYALPRLATWDRLEIQSQGHENRSCPSPTAVIGRVGSIPHLGKSVELALGVWEQEERPHFFFWGGGG